MTALTFTARGVPAPKGSLRHVGNGRLVEQVARSGPWMSVVRAAATVAAHGTGWTHDGRALSVSLHFTVPRPKTVRRVWPVTRSSGDVDKLARAVLDAITANSRKGQAGVITDDSAVIDLTVTKNYPDADTMPGVLVHIELLEAS